MTPQSFQHVREKMGLSRRQMAILLGYKHADPDQDYNAVKKMELGKRPISPMCARLLTMIYRYWSSTGELPAFDDG